MATINIAGILRAGAYSPNHIGNDAAILNGTAEELRKRGCNVAIYSEEQFNRDGVREDIILSMCREQESIKRLQQLEDEGRLVINSGYGIENCTRERMTRILLGNNIPYPKSLIVNTDEAVTEQLRDAGMERSWIKRGDFHAQPREDVSYVRHPEEAQEVLQEYFLRGIKRAVINIHLVGDLIKFYGIKDTPWFFWFYPFDEGHSKYGHEAINGVLPKIFEDVNLQAHQIRSQTKTYQTLLNISYKDDLTGVKNRMSYAAFEERLNARIEAGAGEGFSVVVCDINDLDALLPLSRSSIYRGAKNGDIPCRNVGKRVIFSKADLIRRFGGQAAESIGNAFS